MADVRTSYPAIDRLDAKNQSLASLVTRPVLSQSYPKNVLGDVIAKGKDEDEALRAAK